MIGLGWCNNKPVRQSPGSLDANALGAPAVAGNQQHTFARHAEFASQKFEQVFVGPAFDRRRGNAYFEVFSVGAVDPVPTGIRLDMY